MSEWTASIRENADAARRLADGLRARGVVPGSNPDGVNDDVEKTLVLIDALTARIDELQGALRNLVDIKDGPRDENYEREKSGSWERARQALGMSAS